MSNKVERPQSDLGKIHNKNEFELCYLRHKYIRKTTKNPSKEEMAPYRDIIVKQSHRTYVNYREIFNMVGFAVEDLINTGNVHLVSFLGLFAIENDEQKLSNFKKGFHNTNEREATEFDILDKNKAIFTMFLKQRFEDVVRVCGQKARNIKGLYTEHYHVFCGPQKPPLVIGNLIKNYEKLGFKKISLPVFKSIRKKINNKHNAIFQFDGLWYVCVSVEQKELRLTDFCSAGQDPYDNLHHMDPETTYELKFWKEKVESFENSNRSYKLNKLRDFVQKYQNNSKYKKEISTAKKMLREMGVSVG